MTKIAFNDQGERASDLLELIHNDVYGLWINLLEMASLILSHLLMTSVDMDLCIFWKKNKKIIEKFKNKVKNQLGKSIKAIDQIVVVNT